jgi:hypothetical protein
MRRFEGEWRLHSGSLFLGGKRRSVEMLMLGWVAIDMRCFGDDGSEMMGSMLGENTRISYRSFLDL